MAMEKPVAQGGATMPCDRPSRLDMNRTSVRRGFSLLELMVVILITSLLTAIMFPGLTAARESAHRLMCASNLRQIGTGIILFSTDHNDRIPKSELSRRGRALDQMALTCSEDEFPDPAVPVHHQLDGLGILLGSGYCEAQNCMFCPSHRNTHSSERYERVLLKTQSMLRFPEGAFSNYQYVGRRSGEEQNLPLTDDRLLVTDGFRTQLDVNHVRGMNRLFGDMSIDWWADAENSFYIALPHWPVESPTLQTELFNEAWQACSQGDRLQD
jgi:prepilin-type N-terminal cleavage/methylation domain-containing protein